MLLRFNILFDASCKFTADSFFCNWLCAIFVCDHIWQVMLRNSEMG